MSKPAAHPIYIAEKALQALDSLATARGDVKVRVKYALLALSVLMLEEIQDSEVRLLLDDVMSKGTSVQNEVHGSIAASVDEMSADEAYDLAEKIYQLYHVASAKK